MDPKAKNVILPGNPRYQPKRLIDFFGYDNLYRTVAEVELANLDALAEIGLISSQAIASLTPAVRQIILDLTTTQVDLVEREITKHDIRAWVRCAQEVITMQCGIHSAELNRWVHVPLTSYDALDTARILQYRRAFDVALMPAIADVVELFAKLVKSFSQTVMIGRTHGQHALPITVGFWLATNLQRIIYNAGELRGYAYGLTGKISGAVGAYNAQVGLGFEQLSIDAYRTDLQASGELFTESDVAVNGAYERRVLRKLGLHPAIISSQILPPEPLAYFLFSATMLSASLAQFGRDCRHLMRSEIGEIQEAFDSGQVGSSTMAHKRNPINFENLEGMYLRTKNEFGKVLDTLLSEHQRDLVGSCVARDLPIILVNLTQQLDTLLRGKPGQRFLERLTVNEHALQNNLSQSAHLVMAEPVYIALQMAGFEGDAHELVNRQLVKQAQETGQPLINLLLALQDSSDLNCAISRIPKDVLTALHHPEAYIGSATNKAEAIAQMGLNLVVEWRQCIDANHGK